MGLDLDGKRRRARGRARRGPNGPLGLGGAGLHDGQAETADRSGGDKARTAQSRRITDHPYASNSEMAASAVISPRARRSSTSARPGSGSVSMNSRLAAMRFSRPLIVG